MKIAVNTRLLLKNKLEGIGRFTCESLRRIVSAHPEHTFYFIFDRNYDEQFIFADNVIPIITFPPTRHPYLWYFYFEYSIPYVLKKINADLFFSPDGWLSLRTDIPQIAVIHDLNFEHYTDFLRPSHQKYYTTYFPQFAHKAARLATVSEYSKKDICEVYHIPIEKIDVVYNGSNNQFAPVSPEKKLDIRVRYALGYEYFLFVSAIHKRKNLANMLAAFDAFKTATQSDMQFLIVGERAGLQGDVQQVYEHMQHITSVHFLGYLSQKELCEVMAAAKALVYVSFFEGFGIPIVEAFSAETAVITSTTTAMPEIAGDAALLVNPFSVEDIQQAMTNIAQDEQLRNTLIEKGKLRRNLFTWDHTASLLWDCIEKVIATMADTNPYS